MSKDFSADQPSPQGRENGDVETSAIEAGEPVTGFTQAPRVGLADTGPGPGVPANTRTLR